MNPERQHNYQELKELNPHSHALNNSQHPLVDQNFENILQSKNEEGKNFN
jgi:hypothetical protein